MYIKYLAGTCHALSSQERLALWPTCLFPLLLLLPDLWMVKAKDMLLSLRPCPSSRPHQEGAVCSQPGFSFPDTQYHPGVTPAPRHLFRQTEEISDFFWS